MIASKIRKIVSLALVFVFIISSTASAEMNIYQQLNSPFYDPNSSAGDNSFSNNICGISSSSTGSSNPYFVLQYPAGADPSQVGKNIENWIKNESHFPNSPWIQIPNFGSRLATTSQQLNINPYLIAAIGDQETNLGLTGSAIGNHNSFGEKGSGPRGYHYWPSFEDSFFGSDSYLSIFQGNITGKSPYYKSVTNIWEYLSIHLLGTMLYPGSSTTVLDPLTGKTVDVSYLQIYYKDVKQWIGEMTSTNVDIPPPSGPGSSSGGGSGTTSCSCQQAELAFAKAVAWPTYHDPVFLDKTPAYSAAIKEAVSAGTYTAGSAEPYAGIDCGAFVTVVMVESGADPNYNDQKCNTTCQKDYMDKHPELYENLGAKTSTDGLEPGDIAINSEHTYIYAGDQGHAGYNSLSASTGGSSGQYWRAPTADNAYFSNSAGAFIWYRLKCPATQQTTKPAG